MDYIAVEEARDLAGLRLVLSPGSPNPWAEGAKAVLRQKGIGFVAVAQHPGLPNEALQAWTGQTSSPVAMFDDEKPRPRWNQIILLAERLRPEPALIPADASDRAAMFGLLHEILDEDGLMWNKRVLGLATGRKLIEQDRLEGRPTPANWTPESFSRRLEKYSNGESEQHSWSRFQDVLHLVEGRLIEQQRAGRRFLIGEALSAADLYWAAVTNSFLPLPPKLCPVRDPYRARRRANADPFGVLDGLDAVVLAHRDFIITTYFQVPMDF